MGVLWRLARSPVIGYETIRYIVKDLEGEGTGEDEILDSRVLTEENIDTYMKDDGHSHP